MTNGTNQEDHPMPEQQGTDSRKSAPSAKNRFDPLLALIGSGHDLWADEHADDYVNRLREGWE